MGGRKKGRGVLVIFLLSICIAYASSTPKFFVKKIEIVGNTLLPTNEFAPILLKGEGRLVDLPTLVEIANSVTLLYFKKGYLLARAYIPPQRIEKGIAKICVMEGRVGKISVEGNRYYPSSLIQSYVTRSIKNGFFLYKNFYRSLQLLNEFPDLKVKAVFKPGLEPGTSDLTLVVNDKNPLHEGVDYNNFGNRFIGRNRAGFEVWDGNFSNHGDLADLLSVFPFPSNQNPFLQFEYNRPLGDQGEKIGLTYTTADIKAGQELQPLDIRGTANIYALSYSRPDIRTLRESSNYGITFSLKNVNNFILGSSLTSFDKIRELSGSYDHRWLSSATQDIVEISGTRGLGSLLGGMPSNYTLASRPGVDDGFTRMNADAVRIMKVNGEHLMILRGEYQWSLAPLPITEQYALGGPDSIRGYLQSESLGDSGWLLSAEYRIPFTVKYAPNPIQATFNVGTGNTMLRFPQAGESAVSHLTGAGVGLRTNLQESTSMRVEVGFPIDPAANSTHESPVLYSQFATKF